MKKPLQTILLLLSWQLLAAQQDSTKKDARYRNIIDPCSIRCAPSRKLIIEEKEAVFNYCSDSGIIYMEKSWLSTPLREYINYSDAKDTRWRTDFVFSLLFLKNFLTHDNLICALKTDRKALSQYGDTMDYTLQYVPGNIEIFQLNICPTPAYIKGVTRTFEIGFVQENAREARYHFKIVLDIPRKYKNASLYRKIQNSSMRCLVYQGFEI